MNDTIAARIQPINRAIHTSGNSYAIPSLSIYGCRDALAAFRDAKRKFKRKGEDVTSWRIEYV